MKRLNGIVVVALLLLAGFAAAAQWDHPARGEKWMVASGHEAATEAGLAILRRGGNAFDASVAVCMAITVTRPISASMVTLAPTLIYDARTGAVRGYSGAGTAPARATATYFRMQGWPIMPAAGINSQLIPASPDTWIAVLEEYGTMSFGEAAKDSLRLAEDGFVMNRTVADILRLPPWQLRLYQLAYPYNYSVLYEPFEPEGPRPGDVLVQKDLARTIKLMVAAEADELARSGDRVKGLEAARAVFYEGEIARAIAELHREHHGPMTYDDLASYRGKWEDPVSGTYRGYTIYSNGPWCQGPTVPMILQILENVDLKALGHDTPEYYSAVAQAVELAFADREAYMGDPDFVDVPMKGLLSREYAQERAGLIHPRRAFGKMPAPGDPWKFEGRPRPAHVYHPRPVPTSAPPLKMNHDTTYFCVVDSMGNAVSQTPSDFPYSPMVPGYGLNLGIRMTQFRLKHGHPAQVAPGKRPRITPNPSLVTKDGSLFMAFGTPGGDQQPQAMVQVFLNIVEWGLDPQAAINAPRVKSRNFPDSFSPHVYYPGRLLIEEELAGLADAFKKQGYDVRVLSAPAIEMGAVCVIIREEAGSLIGGADPREEAVARGD
ncbi:MAG TPA: gamma-glutamyltransferase family protein [bacterium]|nr:gamma-glutamyltransferase family protein [bacterium]